MVYKEEKQMVNAMKLKKTLEKDNAPKWMHDILDLLNSEQAKINYWIAIRDHLLYSIENGDVEADSLYSLEIDELKKINVVKFNSYVKNRLDKANKNGVKPKRSTIENKIKRIKFLYTSLVEIDAIQKNPLQSFNKYNTKRNEALDIKLPSADELDLLIENLKSITNTTKRHRNSAIVALFLGSGLRVSELVGLNMCDLHLTNNNEESYVEVIRKGNYSEDDKIKVTITKSCSEALSTYIKILDKEIISSNMPLFTTRTNNRMLERDVYKMIKKYSDNKISPHMLRHYYGTLLYQVSNSDINLVRKQLGHASTNTTQMYAHVTNESLNILKVM